MIITETATSELVDFGTPVVCEGIYHDQSEHGHVAAELAAYYVVAPCGSTAAPQCKSRVNYFFRKATYLKCLACNATHHIDDYDFVPV